jgi:hypothetical protein
MTAARQCSTAIKKYHANKELELVRKNNLGSFYNFIRNKLNNHTVIKEILKPDGTFASSERDIAATFNSFLLVCSQRMMALFPQLTNVLIH